MPDHATSSDPDVQRQLDRLWALSPGADILGLERITTLLARVGDPHRRLPPVFHVAGTNGKGSTCAYLRAAIEAAGLTAHVFTSPHLVRFNERIRLAGTLVADAALARLLEEVLDAGGDIGASFFEVTTAAAFLAFGRTPADACIVEVGLGGRLDATNVLPAPAACGIAQLGVDHQAFLGSDPVGIAGEKAGIAKPGVPLVTLAQAPAAADRIAEVAASAGAPLIVQGRHWHVEPGGRYRDRHGELMLAPPALAGSHQLANAALAVAMLRHQSAVALPDPALASAPARAQWPARLQRLRPGPLTALVPETELWLDGGHNPAAASALTAWLASRPDDTPKVRLVLGMLANKDIDGLLRPLARFAESLVAVPVPGHDHHAPAAIAAPASELGVPASTATTPEEALSALGPGTPILILGSLYLAGAVLAANHELPT